MATKGNDTSSSCREICRLLLSSVSHTKETRDWRPVFNLEKLSHCGRGTFPVCLHSLLAFNFINDLYEDPKHCVCPSEEMGGLNPSLLEWHSMSGVLQSPDHLLIHGRLFCSTREVFDG